MKQLCIKRRGWAHLEEEVVQLEVMLHPAGAKEERAAQQEATRQPGSMSIGGGMSSSCGTTRSHTTTNQANGRQMRIKKC